MPDFGSLYVLGTDVNTPPASPADGDTYIIGSSPTGDWSGHPGEIAFYNETVWEFYPPFNGVRAFVASNGTLIVYSTGNWLVVGSTDLATQSGTETLSHKTLAGGLSIYTDGDRVGLTSNDAPLSPVEALLHVVNDNAVTCGIRASSYWTGSTGAPYQNHDDSAWEVFNKVTSNSLNRSWAGSFANIFNDIPAGVTDSGTRVGAIGWAGSVNRVGYKHDGTLQTQIGIHGTAGFQGPGSGTSAVVVNASGVQGLIYADSADSTIVNAKAGEFISTATIGVVQNNVAVYASAANGTASNYSFFGEFGKFYNQGQVLAGSLITQSSSRFCARGSGNAFEFGQSDSGGYASNFGAASASGAPFLAFCAEVDPTGNTFTTRGKLGTVIYNNLSGALVFCRVTNPNAAGQSLTESLRIDAAGHLMLGTTPYLPTRTPASSTAAGTMGEFCWDANYLYVCVSTNNWKRSALSSW
jgi:hypothetical protein